MPEKIGGGHYSTRSFNQVVMVIFIHFSECFESVGTSHLDKKTIQQQPPFYGHYTGQPALADTSS